MDTYLVMRTFGIDNQLKGAMIMRQMLTHEVKTKQLTDQEIEAVLYAWDGRHNPPIKGRKYMDRVEIEKIPLEYTEPDVIYNEEQRIEEANKRRQAEKKRKRSQVERIEKYLDTLLF